MPWRRWYTITWEAGRIRTMAMPHWRSVSAGRRTPGHDRYHRDQPRAEPVPGPRVGVAVRLRLADFQGGFSVPGAAAGVDSGLGPALLAGLPRSSRHPGKSRPGGDTD